MPSRSKFASSARTRSDSDPYSIETSEGRSAILATNRLQSFKLNLRNNLEFKLKQAETEFPGSDLTDLGPLRQFILRFDEAEEASRVERLESLKAEVAILERQLKGKGRVADAL